MKQKNKILAILSAVFLLAAMASWALGHDPVFIRVRRRPRLRAETPVEMKSRSWHSGVQARAVPVDECGLCSEVIAVPLGSCYGGFRYSRITLRSLGACAPKRYSAQVRRRVFHGGTTGSARGGYIF